MKKFDYIQAAKKIFEIESRVVSELSDQLDESYERLCKDILKMDGKLILMGIGKSGYNINKMNLLEVKKLPTLDVLELLQKIFVMIRLIL